MSFQSHAEKGDRPYDEPPIPMDMINVPTVLAIIAAQDPEKDPPPLLQTSERFYQTAPALERELEPAEPSEQVGSVLNLARECIAERLLRLLGTFARMEAAFSPGLVEAMAALYSRAVPEFHPEVADLIEDRFGLRDRIACPQTVAATTSLARDIQHWTKSEPGAAEQYGLRFDPNAMAIFIRCPRRFGD